MRIYYSEKFAKAYKKLPKRIKLLAEEKEKIFRANPFAPPLKSHKLKGKLSNFYSFSVSYNWRIVFHFEEDDVVGFDLIGTHEVYR